MERVGWACLWLVVVAALVGQPAPGAARYVLAIAGLLALAVIAADSSKAR